jgi:AraC family transcriptional regulator, arabinose operon regulatory protein
LYYLLTMNQKLPVTEIRLGRNPFFIRNEPNWQWDVVVSGHYKLWIVTRGKGELRCNRTLYQVTAGRCHLFCPGEHIQAGHNPDSAVETLSVHFMPEPETAPPKLAMHDVQLSNLDLIIHIGRAAVEAINQNTSAGRQLSLAMCYAILSLAWSDQFRTPPQSNTERIRRLAEEIRIHPTQRRSIAEMAKKCGLSASQFGRTFSAVIGSSPNAFIMEQRIERAKSLLAESTLSIGEIADALNYKDLFYFSRQFKKMTGSSPSDYRTNPHPEE